MFSLDTENEKMVRAFRRKVLKERNELKNFNCITSEYVNLERKVIIMEKVLKKLEYKISTGEQCSLFK